MTDNRYIAAIDIGGSKVVIAVGEVAGDGAVTMVAAFSEPMDGEAVRNGEVRNVINLQSKIAHCLEKLKEEEGYEVRKAVVNLSGADIQCVDFDYTINIRNADKQVTKADLDELLTEAINKHTYDNYYIIDIIPQGYYVDGISVSSPLGTIGKKIRGEFCVIVCDKGHKAIFDEILVSVGITPMGYTLSSLASAEAVLMDDEREYGVAMIDIGSDCSDIVVYKNNIPCDLGVVPLGGRRINDDIESLRVLSRYIERIKVDYGGAKAENCDYNKVISLPIKSGNINKRVVVRELCGVIEARVREIAEEAVRFIEEGGHFEGLGAGIVLTGGCAKLKDIDSVFKEATGYDNVVVRYPEMLGESCEAFNDPEYSTVVGLLESAGFLTTDAESRGGVVRLVRDEPKAARETVIEERFILTEDDDYDDNDDTELPKEERVSTLKRLFGRFKLTEPKDDVNDID